MPSSFPRLCNKTIIKYAYGEPPQTSWIRFMIHETVVFSRISFSDPKFKRPQRWARQPSTPTRMSRSGRWRSWSSLWRRRGGTAPAWSLWSSLQVRRDLMQQSETPEYSRTDSFRYCNLSTIYICRDLYSIDGWYSDILRVVHGACFGWGKCTK